MAKIGSSCIGYVVINLFIVCSLILSSNAQLTRHRQTPNNRLANRTPLHRVHPCEQSSCYPATGNLLIGRENRLEASSTCGRVRPERYCIVSHLEEKKCFLCDTRRETENDPMKNHRIGQIIYKMKPGTVEQTWWQSENGRQNVTIQLDLEAEFHFTHLIIVFATFRPAAMLIERSYDFGKTWHVYKYFAHSCRESFPHAPLIARNITDVICDHRYSGVEPSKNGEVIYRVLPPNMNIENPYAEHVQNMLKMTNLRVNFTKLHSLGDNLLDDRDEIQEKYYYAISNMIVRGSCSCYGHASRCLPLENVINTVDMVHGRCECTHNTKGLNCEECEDFFNDLPWKPALGKQTNACKKCNCNNHATSCHFDQAVYEHSGRVSGGVCDNCQHNTLGYHCEECAPFFYRDPNEDIQSPYVCKPCDCDPRGSLDDGICDSIADEENDIKAGACHCKRNVHGRRCDQCKEGFWNFDEHNPDGCQTCTCNTLGTVNNSGCNVYTGECICKRLVTGRDCNQCMPETYGLSDSPEGCSPCSCHPGGSLDNSCDVITGQCRCRPHMQGRDCSEPKQHYFIPTLHRIVEAEFPSTYCEANGGQNCSVVVRERANDRDADFTGPGFIRAAEGTKLEFTLDDIPKTMNYDVQIRYHPQMKGDWENVRTTVIRPEVYNPEGPCANSHPSYERDIKTTLSEYETSAFALQDICLESGKTYKFIVMFERHNPYDDNPTAQILIDSIVLLPRIEMTPILQGTHQAEVRHREFVNAACNHTYYDVNYNTVAPEECRDILDMISVYINNGATPCECNPTGSKSKKCVESGGLCACKTNVVGRQCDRCAPGTYGFGPEGCKACDCNSIGSKDNDCDLTTGQCSCRPNTYGRECDQCQPGFWNFPNCQICECNGHTPTCNSKTGECIQCQDFTQGWKCDRCVDGYYGNPLLGSSIGCRPCRCPDTIASGHSYANECYLHPSTNDVICSCNEGYSGARCDVCADNYYGNPEKPGGLCQPCDCSNNVDSKRPGNCDAKTGQCLQCLYNTEGDHCEYCRDGYYGDALRQDCQACDCNLLGTNQTVQHCDRYTGQCPCLQNVKGQYCDECIENHWKIASGEGCEACDCDPVGALSEQCNPYDGQCTCKPGFGGRQCNQCEAFFWGDPNVECKPCDCNVYGSATQQCDRTTGKCVCNPGIGGYKCDQCARGYLGQAPYCEPCGECFDNWDMILDGLRDETDRTIEEAKTIKKLGATGAYKKEFDAMAKKIGQIEGLLNNTISDREIETIGGEIDRIRNHLQESLRNLEESERKLQETDSSIKLANIEIVNLGKRADDVKQMTTYLKDNATRLQEGNIEGALNLTRDAWYRVSMLGETNMNITALNNRAENYCRRAEHLINMNQADIVRNHQNNEAALLKYQEELNTLNKNVPDLNQRICDRHGDPCDEFCGGAGCKNGCGGLRCENGALTLSEKALDFAKKTEQNIKEKEELADDIIRSMSQAKANASESFKKAKKTHDETQAHLEETKKLIDRSNALVANLTDMIENTTASPGEMKALIDQVMSHTLQLDPDQIDDLAQKIQDAVSHLVNVEAIIRNTETDLRRVELLKADAMDKKDRAEKVFSGVLNITKALDDADDAQKKARQSIKQANADIASAKIDLEEIEKETDDAQKRANTTANAVLTLQSRLEQLQKDNILNEHGAQEINNQAEVVKESANNAHERATQLKNDFKTANESLTVQARKSESARERAQNLLNRASKITVDTNTQLAELQNMDEVYKSNEKEIQTLEAELNDLTEKVSGYLEAIRTKAEYYRTC
ncbi:laminin subunit beta-1 [Anopheles ziemanni]|uniref:laminin subunit beta-1 n=1 Tax=Anopheles coustani TaxID=139045 RepID=UPI0026592F08|nr:laminin subunit beta-1 [Anopheles coustani]XP_058171441.1 laminin subunit beta-1 [Anopheles ziemanni]